MPKVTIDPNDYTRFDLKSAPPDGYVMLRPLSYGMKLTRRTKSSRMMMEAGTTQMTLETLEEWTTQFDFKNCIGDHNLQNADESLIDFGNAVGWKLLDPRVGSEIERHINSLNEEDDEAMLDDFLKRSGSSSTEDTNTPQTDSGATTTPSKEARNEGSSQLRSSVTLPTG
jgi:hypothetical protein